LFCCDIPEKQIKLCFVFVCISCDTKSLAVFALFV
jgi:hypothetical protein